MVRRDEGFVTHTLGIQEKSAVRERRPRAQFLQQKTVDLEYNYPFGFKELWGLAYRTDYDLNLTSSTVARFELYRSFHSQKFVPTSSSHPWALTD